MLLKYNFSKFKKNSEREDQHHFQTDVEHQISLNWFVIIWKTYAFEIFPRYFHLRNFWTKLIIHLFIIEPFQE